MVTRPPRSTKPPGESLGRILLAEDEIALARVMSRVLEAAGFELALAESGDAAVELLLRGSFDAILSDIHLPGMTGVELLHVIRAYDLDIPVLLMTGSPSIDTAIEAVNLGATQYLLKPIENRRLVEVCTHAIGLRGARRADRERLGRSSAIDAIAHDKRALGGSLDRALESMWMAFQPIVSDRAIIAYEALMRSTEPQLPNPPAVLEAAEKLGRLEQVGRRCRDLAAAAFADAPSDVLLFVNLHASDLLDEELFRADAPLTCLAKRVVLEITERASLESIDNFFERLGRLRSLGFRLAIDDLGAGYAGLSSLALIEPEFVKLDMSLVRDVHRSPIRAKLVGAMATVANELNLRLIAEGVETEEEHECVRKLGCEFEQGYFFAKPGKPFPTVARFK